LSVRQLRKAALGDFAQVVDTEELITFFNFIKKGVDFQTPSVILILYLKH